MKKLLSLFWVTCICTAMIGCSDAAKEAPATDAAEAAGKVTEAAAEKVEAAAEKVGEAAEKVKETVAPKEEGSSASKEDDK